MRFMFAALSLLAALDLNAQPTVTLKTTPASPVSKGRPITLTATIQGQTARVNGSEVLYTFAVQRLTPCPQSLRIAAASSQHTVSWTPPTAGQYSFVVSARNTSPLRRESLSSSPVVVSVEQRLELNPLAINSVNAPAALSRVTASLADPGYAATYTFKFTDFRPTTEIAGNFSDNTPALANWIPVAGRTITSTSPTASWEVTLPPIHHDLKVEVERKGSGDCNMATGTLRASYVVPLPPE